MSFDSSRQRDYFEPYLSFKRFYLLRDEKLDLKNDLYVVFHTMIQSCSEIDFIGNYRNHSVICDLIRISFILLRQLKVFKMYRY